MGESVPFNMCLATIKWNCYKLDASPGQRRFNLKVLVHYIKKMTLEMVICLFIPQCCGICLTEISALQIFSLSNRAREGEQ